MTTALSIDVNTVKILSGDRVQVAGYLAADGHSEAVFWYRSTVTWARRLGRILEDTLDEYRVEVCLEDVITIIPPIEECPACTEALCCVNHAFLLDNDARFSPLLTAEPGEELYTTFFAAPSGV